MGDGNLYKQDRSHLIGRQLGGTGKSPAEMVTLDRRANRSLMTKYENEVARRVRAGDVVEYWVTPLYDREGAAPSAIALSGYGSTGLIPGQIIKSPAAR